MDVIAHYVEPIHIWLHSYEVKPFQVPVASWERDSNTKLASCSLQLLLKGNKVLKVFRRPFSVFRHGI